MKTETASRAHSYSGRLALLLLVALAFVSGQALAQQHVHVDGEQNTICAVCHHAEKSPHPQVEGTQANASLPPIYETPARASHIFETRPRHDHLSRAPPLSS